MTRSRALLVACAALAVSILFPAATPASSGPEGVGIMSDVHVGKGEVRKDDVVCIGGTATIEGKVEGDVVVVGGKLNFSGEAHDVVAILTDADLAPGAVVGGDLVHFGKKLTKDSSVTVRGETVDVGSRLPPQVRRNLGRALVALYFAVRVLKLVAALVAVLLIALLIPNRIERMSEELEPRWPASVGFGILGFIVTVVGVIILAVTIIGLPLAILLGLLSWILGLMGVSAILLVLGKKVGEGTGLTGPEPSVLVSVLVGFALVAIVFFIPFLGELAWLILSLLGLGLALVTKMGAPAPGESAS